MVDKNWIAEYMDLYKDSLFDEENYDNILKLKGFFEDIKKRNKKVMLLGNGGSAAIASHVSVDIAKNAKVRSLNFNEADLITCLANDYGYSEWMAKSIEYYGDKDDMVILISSSGKSENLLNAAYKAKEIGIKIVTFTGFDKDNPLKKEGVLNFWVNSRAYNIIEMTHQIWLLAVCDSIIGKAEYSVNHSLAI